MFHDRVSFGGASIAVGLLYIWLAEFPLREKQVWAWWVFVLSGLSGFGSFLTYIAYGYLDTWHAAGTLALIPLFLSGLYYSFKELEGSKNIRCLLVKNNRVDLTSRCGLGNLCLLFTAFGLFTGGITIMIVGMTSVFVPQDLDYIQIPVCGLVRINTRLVPLIAHDRTSFGSGLATIGVMYFFMVWCSKPGKALWQISLLAISIGFCSAIGVHFLINYLNFWHILPAYTGFLIFLTGIYLTHHTMMKEKV